MQQQQITMLAKIYNTLMTINTKGEDTLIMAECLKAFQNTLLEIQNQNVEEE